MAPPNPFERRHSPAALACSLLVHLVIAAVVLTGVLRMAPVGPVSALPGLLSATRGGGGGGATMHYVSLGAPSAPSVMATPVIPPPPPLVVPAEAPEVVPEAEPVTQVAAALDSLVGAGGVGAGGGAGPGSGGGTGGGSGTGQGTGTGSGAGGAGSGGAEGRAIPPEPRQMIMPPEFPPSMRGLRIAVTFAVAADGRVRQVEFDPSVPDRGYARRLEAVMRDYRFRPARDAAGRDVAGVARVVLSF